MPTLRRILKYTPAVVMGLLIVVWVVSLYGLGKTFVVVPQQEKTVCYLEVYEGTVGAGLAPLHLASHSWFAVEPIPRKRMGELSVSRNTRYPGIAAPFALVLSAILPLAIGPFLSFRFRLWHYLAYTALVAVELAYYLRWQE